MISTNTYNIPPSIYNAWNICTRQAWLMYHQLNANQQNDYLEIGKLIDDMTYKREKKKIYIAELNAEIDMVTKKDGKLCIVEIKKSSKMIGFATEQLLYYLYLLHCKGINVSGLIKIPKEKTVLDVNLGEEQIAIIENRLKDINTMIENKLPPRYEKKIKFCRKCAHLEFCWA